jgi:hypothetical protein
MEKREEGEEHGGTCVEADIDMRRRKSRQSLQGKILREEDGKVRRRGGAWRYKRRRRD